MGLKRLVFSPMTECLEIYAAMLRFWRMVLVGCGIFVAMFLSSCSKDGPDDGGAGADFESVTDAEVEIDRHEGAADGGDVSVGQVDETRPGQVPPLTGMDTSLFDLVIRIRALPDFEKQKQEALRLYKEDVDFDSLGHFLWYLRIQHQGEVLDWMLNEEMIVWFSGADSSYARGWVLTLGDKEVQKKLAFVAGRGLSGDVEGLKEFFELTEDVDVKSRALAGYCAAGALADPAAAIDTFHALRPKGGDFAGLQQVMEAVPSGSDFIGLSGKLPGDSKTLAKNARRALLRKWAKSAPQAAADYVLGNKKLVHADQLGVVTERWGEKDITAAVVWVDGLKNGDYGDQALAGLVRSYGMENAEWGRETAAVIGNAKLRNEVMKGLED